MHAEEGRICYLVRQAVGGLSGDPAVCNLNETLPVIDELIAYALSCPVSASFRLTLACATSHCLVVRCGGRSIIVTGGLLQMHCIWRNLYPKFDAVPDYRFSYMGKQEALQIGAKYL